jgi:hypothetical protein
VSLDYAVPFFTTLFLMLGASFIGSVIALCFFAPKTNNKKGEPLLTPMEITLNGYEFSQADGQSIVRTTHSFKTSELSNELVTAWLDREGFVAMPKGFDLGSKPKVKS